MGAHWTLWIQHWGYPAVFLGVMAESMGIPFPGETIIIAATLLVVRHGLRFEGVYAAALLGAVIGDNVGYWIGHRGGRPLIQRMIHAWHLSPAAFEQAERDFKRYGPWAVFFGRFVTLLRTWAGPLAGVTRFPWWEFFLFNAAGAVVWVATVMALTRLFGAALERLLDHAEWAVLLVALGGFVVWFLIWRSRAR